jgi:hypothetical protein
MGNLTKTHCESGEQHTFQRHQVLTGRRGTWYTKSCTKCKAQFACSEAEYEELPERVYD